MASNKSKNEFPPILGAGLHRMSFDELKSLTVDSFPKSNRRLNLWDNFITLVEKVRNVRISCEIWVDGSFLTKKMDPEDIDFVVDVPLHTFENCLPDQAKVLKEIAGQAFRCTLNLHSFLMFNAPAGHRSHSASLVQHAQWERDFGFSFVNREPKGIAVVEVKT